MRKAISIPKIQKAYIRAKHKLEFPKAPKSYVLAPVRLEGVDLALTSRGRAWMRHLETLPAITRHIWESRHMVRHDLVDDLRVAPGYLIGCVSSEYSSYFRISVVRFAAVSPDLNSAIGRQILQYPGDLPAAILPSELDLQASCVCGSGWCDHTVALLCALACRLDVNPELLLELRSVPVTISLETKTLSGDNLLNASRREMEEIFGLPLEADVAETRPKGIANK